MRIRCQNSHNVNSNPALFQALLLHVLFQTLCVYSVQRASAAYTSRQFQAFSACSARLIEANHTHLQFSIVHVEFPNNEAKTYMWSYALLYRTLASISALRCSAMSALRIPKAMLDSYIVWYAAMVIWISSLTRRSSSPRSAQFIVTCLMSSSFHDRRRQGHSKRERQVTARINLQFTLHVHAQLHTCCCVLLCGLKRAVGASDWFANATNSLLRLIFLTLRDSLFLSLLINNAALSALSCTNS